MRNFITTEKLADRFVPVQLTPTSLLPMLNCDKSRIRTVTVSGITCKATPRFLRSLTAELKIPDGAIGYFTPEAVLRRAAELYPLQRLRLTLDLEAREALGVTADVGLPTPVGSIERILHEDERLTELRYEDGVIVSMLDLRDEWDVPHDSVYGVTVRCRVPVDGIDASDMTLSAGRRVCKNGQIAESPVYRTKLLVRDRDGDHFRRMVASFNNPVGAEMLQGRISTAAETKASVRELLHLEGVVCRAVADPRNQLLVRERLNAVAGDPCLKYGVADLTGIGERKRALLPVECSVADLLNVASELTTHYSALLSKAELLYLFIGGALSKGFDLEDLYRNARDASAFYLRDVDFVRTAAA